ncbi:MAG: CoB--CoM heterodisulfide reductase iron-sulfur subunit B family protein [Candidatus Thorarchaeota archaeon]
MRLAYYPGCISRSVSQGLLESTALVASKVDLDLVKLTQASCCGAGYLNQKSSFLGTAINARTLAIAERLKLDLVTGCSTCLTTLSIENERLKTNESLRNRVNNVLSEFELEFRNGPKIKHLAEVLTSSPVAERIIEESNTKLHNWRMMIYPGCHSIRPFPVNHNLEALLVNLGAKIRPCETWNKCCGFHTFFTHRKMSLSFVGSIIEAAVKSGSNLVVTLCPLCYIALDSFQADSRREGVCRHSLPILHLPQVLGIAMGIRARHLGLQKNITSTETILHSLEV